MSSAEISVMRARHSARLNDRARAMVASRVRDLAEGRFSRRSLAAETGLGIGTVMDIFAGRSDPTLSTLLALANAFGLHSIEELLGPLHTEAMIVLQGEPGADDQVA